MTCNKAQGQTLGKVGIVLRTPAFSHGQLYVAMSRVRKSENIFIHNPSKNKFETNNVVFRSIFDMLQVFWLNILILNLIQKTIRERENMVYEEDEQDITRNWLRNDQQIDLVCL